jgi:hypothetical protein
VNNKNLRGMDLDALKSGINNRLEQPVTVMSRTVVCKVPRSRGLLIRLRRNLWIETALYLLSIPAILFEAWRTKDSALSIYLVTCAVLMCLLAPVFARLAGRITRHIHADHSVQDGLNELLDIMKTYQRRYLQFNLMMVPVCLIYAIALVLAFPGEAPGDDAGAIPMAAWQIWLMFVGSLLLLMASTWFIAKWWIHWLYGRYIRDLETEVRNVEETE